MPRKSITAELQAEEARPSSPLRRSNRVVIGNATAPAAGITKTLSQSSSSQENIPARATRSRRASTQDSVEISEVKPITKTRRASLLAEEGIQKETPSTPTRRTRKPSITTESTDKEESEKPKPIRGRRNSSTATEEPDEKKPQKLAAVRSRRNSANIEPETEIKVTTKTPLRTTRRRSSATENAVVEEVSTPAKRTTRGRKASDTDQISEVKEEVKKPITRGRKKSDTLEEDDRNEEHIKPVGRKGRKLSTDDPLVSTAPKTSGKFEDQSVTKESDSENASETQQKKKDSSEVQSVEEGRNSDELLAMVLSEIATKLTPVKKKKVLEKMEELGLSTINEISDDVSRSKHDECSEITVSVENKKEDHDEEMSPMILKEAFINITPLKKRKILDKMEEMDLSVINESSDSIDHGEHNKTSEVTESVESEQDNKQIKLHPKVTSQSAEDLVEQPLNSCFEKEGSPNRSLKSADETHIDPPGLNNRSPKTPSKKRLSSGNSEISSPRKSPRLSEKLFNSPKKQVDHGKAPTPQNTINIMKETEKELSVNEKTAAPFVSSGSDDSFRFHLSNVSITNSGQYDSNKETTQEDVLNTSTGSNKENIEHVDSLNISKTVLDVTAAIPIQKPIAASRVSNVFKPNQKDCSFMEPMEIDEDSVIYLETSQAETNSKLDHILDHKTAEKVSSSVEVSNDGLSEMSSDLDERSVICNYRASVKSTKEMLDYKSTPASPNQREEAASILEPTNLTEAEGSDTNLIVEETQDTVNFSIKPKAEKTDNPASIIIAENHSCPSPARVDASLIINQPLEELKVVLSRKSSSPIITRRKSKSPLAKTGDIPDSGSDVRRSSGSPYGSSEPEALTVPRKSKSKSPSPRRSSIRSPSFLSVGTDKTVKSRKSTSPAAQDNKMPIQSDRSRSKSPSFLSVDIDKKVKSRKSTSPATQDNKMPIQSDTSRSKSPKSRRSPSFLTVDIDKKVKSRKSTSPATQDNKMPIQSDRSRSKSPKPRRSPSFLSVDIDKKVKSRKSTSPAAQDNKMPIQSDTSRSKSPKPRRSPSFLTVDIDKKVKSRKSTSPAAQDNKTSIQSDRSRSKSPKPRRSAAKSPSCLCVDVDIKSRKSSSPHRSEVGTEIRPQNRPVSDDDSPKGLSESKTKLLTEVDSPVIRDNEKLTHRSSMSKSSLPESAFLSSYEKPKGTEEILVINVKNTKELDDILGEAKVDDEGSSLKHLPDSVATNICETTQTRLEEMSDINVTDSEGTNVQDKTEYHTAVATTNNESAFTSLMTTDNEVSKSNVKHSESHYDFDLDSDADDLMDFKENTSGIGVQTSVHDKQTLAAEEELENQSQVVAELKKSKSDMGKNDTVSESEMQLETSSKGKEVTHEKYNVVNDETEPDSKKRQKRICLDPSRNSDDMDDNTQNDSQLNKSLGQMTSCSMGVQKADKSQSRNSSSMEKEATIKDFKSSKRKPSLEEFASLKLEEYLGSKTKEIEESSGEEKDESKSEEEEESEAEYNQFIDGMAEEGEEDTPSEDSNQIIDEGESIGFSSNEEISDDSYDENDSFICDDEEPQLLSGDEYDLGNEKKKKKTKKSRIIDPNTLNDDDDIIKIPEKKIEPKKRSRIITVSDSSDEEPITEKESAENVPQGQTVNESVILIENSTTYDDSIKIIEETKRTRPETPTDIETKNKTASESPHITVEDSQFVDSVQEVPVEDSKIMNYSKETPVYQSDAKDSNNSIVTEESYTESFHNRLSLSNLNASLQKRNRKSSLSIQENILVDGVQDPLITKRINDLVDSFCSTVTQGEVALNLSLEFEDTSQENKKKQVINVLSDIKIYPSQSIVSQEADPEIEVFDEQEDVEDAEPEEAKLGSSLGEPEDLKELINRRNLKRRLSKSVDDIQEEVTATKRRKTHKNDKKKAASLNKITQPGTSKTKKRNKNYAVEQLSSPISSFSIMNQLVTDVKNRPKRMIKPTKTDVDVENTWTTTKITNLKPSTSPLTKKEKNSLPPKLHPKDFKNQMLSDEKRVKRVDTKTLLKKKGAFY